jgi:hypothetical protein
MIKPRFSPAIVAENLRAVREKAAFVWRLTPNEEVVEKVNRRAELNVIAIIGEGQKPLGDRVTHQPEVLLAEIGIGRTRPYRPAYSSERGWIAQRHKYFALTEEQYLLIAPRLFATLQQLADQKISGWKSGGQTKLLSPRAYYVRRVGQLDRSSAYRWWEKGVHFSFSLQDQALIADAYWAEINVSRQRQRQMIGLARFIALCLAPYRHNGYSFNRWCQLSQVRPLVEVLARNSLPHHLLVETFKFLPHGLNNPHIYHLARLVDWDLSATPEETLAQQAYLGARKRLGPIQLKVDHTRPEKGYLVVEILASEAVKAREDRKRANLQLTLSLPSAEENTNDENEFLF